MINAGKGVFEKEQKEGGDHKGGVANGSGERRGATKVLSRKESKEVPSGMTTNPSTTRWRKKRKRGGKEALFGGKKGS